MTHIQTGKEGRIESRDNYCPFVEKVAVEMHRPGG